MPGGALGDGSLLAIADDWIRTYTLNTLQLVLLIQTTLPILRQLSQGAVVTITSISGRLAAPRAQYGASEAATRYVVEALEKELGPTGIRINAVAPGSVMVPAVIGITGALPISPSTKNLAPRCCRAGGLSLPTRWHLPSHSWRLSPSGITGIEMAVDAGQFFDSAGLGLGQKEGKRILRLNAGPGTIVFLDCLAHPRESHV